MAGTKSETNRDQCGFEVKEYAGGTPWLMVEQGNSPLAILHDGFLGFDLEPGVTYEEAQALATFMNHLIAAITHTRFLT